MILCDIRIPRWVHFHPKALIQYHGFCDTSQSAYGTAIYVRVERNDMASTHLLAANTRLELRGAVLLVELCASLFQKAHIFHFGLILRLFWHGYKSLYDPG